MRCLMYFETCDGSLLRSIPGSFNCALTCVDVSLDGKFIAVGTIDGKVRVYLYNEGCLFAEGCPRGSTITCVKFNPDSKRLLAGCENGQIYIFRVSC